ncbi:hypothetical protein ABL78_4538 [Leptomonas seymouri]|uniref:CULT domain-containing protein n=1 Tax=Leptomonas seymouri TaxID=5684 RepID=A0A0N0P5U2_LEPSE|nr:hypothetical protein ABL78_4538 [Leptomonas seymouri]|eukprot:KPI86387.1 hypothetical protein ABL78_4538 [Leptomonas seymouri]
MTAPVSAADSTTATAAETVAVLLCDSCRCPIGSEWDVLPAEVHAPVWKDQVYSYELDLFANGSPPIQAYSATNPSKRRFDLLRLAPHVTVHGAPAFPDKAHGGYSVGASASPAGSTATPTRAPPFVECDIAVYSSEHTFFPGYAWCFGHCSNCGAFLGWGFASEERLRAAAPAGASEAGDGPGDDEAAKRNTRQRVEPDDSGTLNAASQDTTATQTRSPSSVSTSPAVQADEDHSGDSWEEVAESHGSEGEHADPATPSAGVAPDFIGIIITNCTGESSYPVPSLLNEVEWRPWRLQRRKRIQAIARDLRQLLLNDADGYHAHRVHYVFESIVRQTFLSPPAIAQPVVGEDDLPPSLLEVLELARASVRRQHEDRITQEEARRAGGGESDGGHSDEDDDADSEASTDTSEEF